MKTRFFAWPLALAGALTLGTGLQGDNSRSKRPNRAEISPNSAGAMPVLAATPPMGWNSWDGYGTTINEEQVKANAVWFASHLKAAGWQYVVIDMEWFVTNPTAEGNSKNSIYTLDANGRYVPAANRFPSSADGKGFKPIGDYIHSLGLKFGIHILRGIPKKAVENNSPIAGSSFRARDAADTNETCPWNPDNFGSDASRPAAQAYYDSIAALYASWGVDLIKVDCIASHPYRGDEIRMLSAAIAKSGRPIVLSLSPGPAPIEKAHEMAKYAQMWRISNDIWDLWHSPADYPQGLSDQFANVLKWAGIGKPGHWPDADMLPLGYLGPAPAWGKPRQTQLTHDEQRTLMTLWSIFPSPLMIGGDLTKADKWTESLLTNREVLAVDQHSTGSRPLLADEKSVAWIAETPAHNAYYLAAFNRTNARLELSFSPKQHGLADADYEGRDLWSHTDLPPVRSFTLRLPAHGCVLFKLRAVQSTSH